jgi:hypothetical protein
LPIVYLSFFLILYRINAGSRIHNNLIKGWKVGNCRSDSPEITQEEYSGRSIDLSAIRKKEGLYLELEENGEAV